MKSNTTPPCWFLSNHLDDHSLLCEDIFKNITDINLEQSLLDLYTLYGKSIYKALEILDAHYIEIVYLMDNIDCYFFRVQGSDVLPYITLSNYCSCKAYYNEVIIGTEIYCKHQLACRLAISLWYNEQYKPKSIKMNKDKYIYAIQSDKLRMLNKTPHK